VARCEAFDRCHVGGLAVEMREHGSRAGTRARDLFRIDREAPRIDVGEHRPGPVISTASAV
jgi:hypothetical protein